MKRFYDGKLLFETYHGWGKAASYRRLVQWARQNNPNPEEGTASVVGVRRAMWNWAAKNPEESYEIWKPYHLERYPLIPVPPIEDYVKNEIIRIAHNNPGILAESNIDKLLMRFGLPYEGIKKVMRNDVIQIVNPSYVYPVSGARAGMYGKLLIVDDVYPEEGFVVARMVNGDDTYSNHQLKYKDFGIIGRAIV